MHFAKSCYTKQIRFGNFAESNRSKDQGENMATYIFNNVLDRQKTPIRGSSYIYFGMAPCWETKENNCRLLVGRTEQSLYKRYEKPTDFMFWLGFETMSVENAGKIERVLHKISKESRKNTPRGKQLETAYQDAIYKAGHKSTLTKVAPLLESFVIEILNSKYGYPTKRREESFTIYGKEFSVLQKEIDMLIEDVLQVWALMLEETDEEGAVVITKDRLFEIYKDVQVDV